MYTLYIDTHYTKLVIGLFKEDLLISKTILENAKHSDNTVNLIEKTLKVNNVLINDLKNIIVINGPGSFTGVRIGVVIAKIFGYTKNISLKAISYLQAMALNYNYEVTVGIKDRNGAYIGEFDCEHELIKDYYYVSNDNLDDKNIKFNDDVDLNKIYNFLKNKEYIKPDDLKPLYVKKIEVEHD